MPKRPLTTKSTKLHQIVEDFNENEVINNPKWGSAIFSENHLNKERISAIPIKKLTSPAFEKDRGIKLRERGKLTSGNFFPRIESPNSNLYKKINNQKK